jgi:purine-binding chemotaxis protein CheW
MVFIMNDIPSECEFRVRPLSGQHDNVRKPKLEERMTNWDELFEQLDWDDATRQERALQSRLKERARQYATPKIIEEDVQDEQVFHVLAFTLGKERYAVDVKVVRGVRSTERLTRVPATPLFYRGVVNIRGQIISVLELRAFFDLAYDPTQTPKEMIVIEGHNLQIAILADHVSDVLSIPKTEVDAIDLRYAYGITQTRLIVLDVEQILTDGKMIVGGKGV